MCMFLAILVTESEITEGMYGLPSSSLPQETCLCILREIPAIEKHINETIAQKFIDLKSDDCIDEEAQKLLSLLRQTHLPSKLPESNITQVQYNFCALYH